MQWSENLSEGMTEPKGQILNTRLDALSETVSGAACKELHWSFLIF